MTKRPSRGDWSGVKGWQRVRSSWKPKRRRSFVNSLYWNIRYQVKQTAVGLAVILVGFGGYSLFQSSRAWLPTTPIEQSESNIVGVATHVRDGDTIEVGGVAIRLSTLDCAESDTVEGQRATVRMNQLVSGQTLSCSLHGRTSYDRQIGDCQLSSGDDIGDIMIRESWCRRYH